MTDTVFQALNDYISSEFGVMHPEVEITPDTLLLSTGVLDSLNLFLLLTFIEERFGVIVEPEAIVPENFDTLASIVRFVQAHVEV